MNQHKWYHMLRGTLYPLLMAVLGLVLLIDPDVASAMLGRLTGWILILAAISAAAYGLLSSPVRIAPTVLGVLVLIPGIYLLADPMVLAKNIGKIGGILLILQGINGLLQLQGLRDFNLSVGRSWIIPICTLILGVVLIFFPLSASRLVFRIMGLIFLLLGILNLISRLLANNNRPLDQRPDIIDADE